MKEINLKELIDKYDILDFTDTNKKHLEDQINQFGKEVWNLAVDKCAENAKLCINPIKFSCVMEINKQSILQVKEMIK